MRRSVVLVCLVAVWNGGYGQEPRSGIPGSGLDLFYLPDLVIGNARIIDGTGNVLEQGSIVVRDGTIASVSATVAEAEAPVYIDAAGMTVLPGLIDTHRHLLPSQFVNSDEALDRWLEDGLPTELRTYLAAGVTPIVSTGD